MRPIVTVAREPVKPRRLREPCVADSCYVTSVVSVAVPLLFAGFASSQANPGATATLTLSTNVCGPGTEQVTAHVRPMNTSLPIGMPELLTATVLLVTRQPVSVVSEKVTTTGTLASGPPFLIMTLPGTLNRTPAVADAGEFTPVLTTWRSPCGSGVGVGVGAGVGSGVGSGVAVGDGVGSGVGEGEGVGAVVGAWVGAAVGACVGAGVGAGV